MGAGTCTSVGGMGRSCGSVTTIISDMRVGNTAHCRGIGFVRSFVYGQIRCSRGFRVPATRRPADMFLAPCGAIYRNCDRSFGVLYSGTKVPYMVTINGSGNKNRT